MNATDALAAILELTAHLDDATYADLLGKLVEFETDADVSDNLRDQCYKIQNAYWAAAPLVEA